MNINHIRSTGGSQLATGNSVDFRDEFRLSSIPDRLTLANVQWVEGDAAVRIVTETAIASQRPKIDFVRRRSGGKNH
jgi:hypothetical protein